MSLFIFTPALEAASAVFDALLQHHLWGSGTMSDQVLIKMYVGIHEVPRAGTQKETQPPAESSLLGDEWTQTSSFCRPHIPTLAKAKDILLLDFDNKS